MSDVASAFRRTSNVASGFSRACFVVFLLSITIAAADRFPASGGEIIVTPIVHASVQVEHAGKVIHVDPWRQGDYSQAKPADVVLITDIQSDHLDLETLPKVLERSERCRCVSR